MPEEERGGIRNELELGFGSHKYDEEEKGGDGIEEDSDPADEPAGVLSEEYGCVNSEESDPSEDDETSLTSDEPPKSGKNIPAEDSPTIS